MNSKLQQRNGQVFLFFLMITTICLLLTVALLSLQAQSYRTAVRLSQSKEAVYLAEAGIDKGLAAITAESDYIGESFALGNGQVTISITAATTENEQYLTSEATVNGATKRSRITLTTEPSTTTIPFPYAILAGTDGLSLGNGSTVQGNIHSNGNITNNTTGQVTGSATAAGSIASTLTVTGAKGTSATSITLPGFDATLWQEQAKVGNTINGNYTPTNGSTIGPLFINGTLILTDGSQTTIAGPVYASGGISFGNDATITTDESLEAAGTVLAANGQVVFGNSITVNGTSKGRTILIVSMNAGNTAINIGKGTKVVSGALYAPNGGIAMGTDAQASALAGRRVNLGPNTILHHSSTLATGSYRHSPTGAWTIKKGSYQEY